MLSGSFLQCAEEEMSWGQWQSRISGTLESESVNNFFCRLERTFQLAYDSDGMLPETRDAMLYSKRQKGLEDKFMKGPAVRCNTLPTIVYCGQEWREKTG